MLAGGGNLGAIQVGMLRALTEHGIVPDVVLGCSVGALNGAAYARQPTAEGVDRLEEHWASTTSHTLMPSSRVPSAVQLLRRGTALHSNSGLRDGIERLLGADTLVEDLDVAFQCVATDVEAALEEWFDSGPLVDAVLASAALPAVYPPVTIGGRRYVDGGVVDNVPLSRAVELGCRTVYVLQMGRHGRPDAELRRPLDGALLAYWIARNSRFARDLAGLPSKVEAVVLPPGERPDLRYDDFSRTAELVEQGYRNSLRFLTEREIEAGERSRGAELLAPIERLAVSTRWRSLRQTERVAESPDGAVVTGGAADDADAGASGDVVAEGGWSRAPDEGATGGGGGPREGTDGSRDGEDEQDGGR